MDIGVLGPLFISAHEPAEYIELAPKPRTVLAVLVANAGATIPVSSLVREVWGDAPPASALRNLQTYVLQSRKMLSHLTGLPLRVVAGELLMTRPGGYTFSDTAAHFDYRSYLELTERGRRSLRNGAVRDGIELYARALGLWRGPAFVDAVTGPALEAQRRQLEESRLSVVEALSDARINVGHYHEAISDLAASVSEHPLHEGLHFQYMRVLDITGSRARALEVFNRLRLNLVSELGIEPGAPVQQLQHHILNAGDYVDHPDHPAYTAPYPPSTGRMTPVV
ncbi:AfsR/SARP family transcriptional regulator [Streptomyces sp. WAC06614]|uniref:AfsR/SARP family transcriptional regulator n=1 Tax=Streptomyces sp. WAC06614 TaxID=2487416 RepID=UPI00163C013F|nr:AfsR/SARP family transcriptional regulator [Streptomyces sp. WAC06614]